MEHDRPLYFIREIARATIMVWRVHPCYTLLVAFLAIVQGIQPAIQLFLSKLLLDTVAATVLGELPGALMRLLTITGVQACVLLLSTVLATMQDTIRSLLGELLSNQINLQLLNKTSQLEIAFFEHAQFYDQLQNARQEAGHRPLQIVVQLFALVQTIVALSSVTLLLLRFNWAILPLILLTTLPLLVVQNRYGHENYRMLRERAPELRKQQYLATILTADWLVKEIRLFQLEDYFTKLHQTLFAKFYSKNRRLLARRNIENSAASVISIIGWLLASGYVMIQIAEGTITIGDFALYIQAISVAMAQIQSLVGGISGLYMNILFLRNLSEFLCLPICDPSNGQMWTDPIKEIEFRDVSFRYSGADREVLHNISFRIKEGESLALVGKNGAGKTTIVKLLSRLYEPTSGEILINGKNIAEYSPRSIQEQISVLFQDYGTYHLTAKENIGVGRVSLVGDMAAIRGAAQRSGADGFIEDLPEKYETTLGKWFKDGVQLSGGEWQKVALARGFLRGGSVLILDEPTASLDAEAEHEVFEDLVAKRTDQIILLISHRFSTVRIADHILVLDCGECIESGGHDELMTMNGQYAYLFNLQAHGYGVDCP